MDAAKFDKGKPRLDLLPTNSLIQVAKVLEFGAAKYGEHNWRRGMAWSKMLGAALRHIFQFMAGTNDDEESKLPHLAHAACCLLVLLEYFETRPNLDDRYVAPSSPPPQYRPFLR